MTEREHYKTQARERLGTLTCHQVRLVADRFGVDHSPRDTKAKIYKAIEAREESDDVLPGSYLQVAEDDGVI